MTFLRGVTCALVLVACGDDDRPMDRDADVGRDAAVDSAVDAAARDSAADAALDATDAGVDAGEMCPRLPAPADRVRRVVISHPFATDGAPAEVFEVLELSQDGTLSRPDTTFTMGRATQTPIAFTPDGEVGAVAQDDGSLGVFRLNDDGSVEVMHASYDGAFFATAVVPALDGTGFWIRDAQFRASGGGIYFVEIGCDGAIASERMAFPAKLPYGFLPRADGSAVVFARDVLDVMDPPEDAFLVTLDTPMRTAQADVFDDDDWIGSSSTLTANGRHALIADNSIASTNRVGVVSLGGGAIAPVQVISPFEDPAAVVASPFDDAAIVLSAFGNAIFRLSYNPDAALPFVNEGELTYMGGRPALPSAAALVDRGTLSGLVVIAENVSVRQVRFMGGGAVTDLGAFGLGDDSANIVGTIGVQP
ncbi:MAG: hypothetical protein AAGE52_23100 [Myxococcota bacterium]